MEGEPQTKRSRTEESIAPVAGPSKLPVPESPPPLLKGAGDGTYVEKYPVSTAGAPIGDARRKKGDLAGYLRSCGRMGDRELFESAEILMTTGLTGRGRTRHLKGPAYKRWKGKEKEVWLNDAALLRDVDTLPQGAKWTTAEVTVGNGLYKRKLTVYLRDILEVIRQLIGAARFEHCMRYTPERRWTSRDRKYRAYDEMWTADWWWRMQGVIGNPNGTVVPLIVASDETTLANNPSGAKAHPVYLSTGLEPLKTASSEGILAWCADGYLRHIGPIIAAWIADWPEQNDLACTTQSGCPKCTKKRKGRSQGGRGALLRDREVTIRALRTYEETERPVVLKPLDLRPAMPFWAGIPHIDFGLGLAPDLLHQFYKGLFEHARKWVKILLETKEFNRRFKTMPGAQDLRHFKNGVTTVTNWAGRESRDMVRQFLPVVIDAQAPSDYVRMIRALLDFTHLAHNPRLTDIELTEMNEALATFHKAKKVLVEVGAVKKIELFDKIAKLHILGHYMDDTRELGTPDGYSTEIPGHLHIIYVKIPWRMSNRRNPLPQMVNYFRRIEAIQMQRTIMDECYGEQEGADEQEIEQAQLWLEELSKQDGEGEHEDEHDCEHDDDDGAEERARAGGTGYV